MNADSVKLCKKCGTEPRYHTNVLCHTCYLSHRRERYALNPAPDLKRSKKWRERRGKPAKFRLDKTCAVCGVSPTYRISSMCLDCCNTARRAYYARNPEPHRASSRQTKKNNRAEVLKEYGGKCTCCGESIQGFLSIDHIHGGGNEHRRRIGLSKNFYSWLKKQGFPKDDFRINCYNCNLGRAFNNGICPHQTQQPLATSAA